MRSLALLALAIALASALAGCASLSSDCVEVAYCPTVTFGVSVEIPLYGSEVHRR